MAPQQGGTRASRTILAVVIGLAIAAVIGVGLHAAYPQPRGTATELKKLDEQQRALDSSRKLLGKMSMSHKATYTKATEQIAAEKMAVLAREAAWSRTTSIILLVSATLLMGTSLLVAAKAPVVSDALFAGGLFTAVYAAVWSFTATTGTTRVVVPAIAVLVALILGYMKLAQTRRGRGIAPSAPDASGSPTE